MFLEERLNLKKTLREIMDQEKTYEWRISYLPSLDNSFNRKIKKMNLYGKLPFPYSYLARIYREIIEEKYLKINEVRIDYGFYCAFGNLYGKSVWFTNTYILDYAPIYFGEHITIGPDVKIITSWHEPENFNIVKAKSIVIEDNVWITMNVIVLPGVTIGKNSIVAAGSVLTKSVPQNSLVAGNPAKVIRHINRDFPYWEELNTDIKSKYSQGNKNFFRIIRFPLKLIRKTSSIILKKIL